MNRKLMAAAYAWKRWRLAQLRTEIELHETLAYALRSELAELHSTEGTQLLLMLEAAPPEEIARMRADGQAWIQQLWQLWLAPPFRKPAA